VNDGEFDSEPATVSLIIDPVNDAPAAAPQSVMTDEDTAKTFALAFSDIEGDQLTFTVLTQPMYGTLSGEAPDLTYTPDLNYNGTDSFTFLVNDGELDSAPATVTLIIDPVNDAPVAEPQSIGTTQDTPVSITLSGSDIDDDPLTYTISASPMHGTLSGTAPDLTYTPNPGFTGSDSFQFQVKDSDLFSELATISISVEPTGPVTVFWDDFETDQGWIRNPNRTDTAYRGTWERANPQSVYYNGYKQLGITASGSYDLVTGPLSGRSAGDNDVDGGITTMRSPNMTLPSGRSLTLTFSYYFAHANNSSSVDYLRVKIVGSTTSTIFQEVGARNDDDASWQTFSVSLNNFAGQTVYILIEAADAGNESLVEAAIDDVLIVAK